MNTDVLMPIRLILMVALTASGCATIRDSSGPSRLEFRSAPLETLLTRYSEISGRTILKPPNLPKIRVTFKGPAPQTPQQSIKTIKALLEVHGVGLVEEANFARAYRLVSQRPSAQTRELHVLPLHHAQPSHIGPILQQALDFVKDDDSSHVRGDSKILADDRTHTLIVITNPANMAFVKKLLAILDADISNTKKKTKAVQQDASSLRR